MRGAAAVVAIPGDGEDVIEWPKNWTAIDMCISRSPAAGAAQEGVEGIELGGLGDVMIEARGGGAADVGVDVVLDDQDAARRAGAAVRRVGDERRGVVRERQADEQAAARAEALAVRADLTAVQLDQVLDEQVVGEGG